VRPQIADNYRPLEVESLSEPVKSNEDYLMTNAEIIGNRGGPKRGMVEKPIMYDTVITAKSTSIRHGDENVGGFGSSIQTSKGALSMFQGGEINRLSQGEMAIPVKLEMKSNLMQDPTLANYETPSFLSKGQEKHALPLESKYPEPIRLPKVPMISPNIQATSQLDAKKIKEHLKKANNSKQIIAALSQEKKRLKSEARGITDKVEAQVNELLKTKEMSSRLNSLLERYTLKMKKDDLKKIKLADRVEIKNELKQKLFKEIQGFRVKGDQFKEVDKVDKSDLQKIVNSIKKKLGY
jgi:hypothetical protein